MRYTSSEREWLRTHYASLGMKEAARQFNEIFNHSQKAKSLSVYCNRSLGLKVDADITSHLRSINHNHSTRNVTGRRFYEENEKEWLRENYPKLGVKETTRQFNALFDHNKNERAIKKYCRHRLGLNVPKEKTIELKSVPIGYKYRNCRGEWRIKTDQGWKRLSHTIVDVPKGCIAYHLDGNRENDAPENLRVIKNGIQTIARNCEVLSEDPTITSVGLTWSELYSELKKQKGRVNYG